MRGARLLLVGLAALAVGACARQQPAYYVMDPSTGQPVPVVAQQQYAAPSYEQSASPTFEQADGRGLYSSSPAYAQQSYGQPTYAQQSYAQQSYAQQQAEPSGRGA